MEETTINETEVWDLSEIFGESRDLIEEINDDSWDLVAGDDTGYQA
jgi:hypothetical protein